METAKFLQDVRNWLAAHGKDRAWLGEQVGVSKRTVDNWFSQMSIPDAKRELVEKAIAARPGHRAVVNCSVRFTVEEWAAITAALPPGADVEEDVRRYLLGRAVRKAEEYLDVHDPRPDEEGTWLEAADEPRKP